MEPAGAVAAVHAGAAACRHRRACRAPLAPPRARHRCRNAGGRRERRALMFAYLVRRALYAIPILIGVNLLTFVLFFVVNSPDDMAREIRERMGPSLAIALPTFLLGLYAAISMALLLVFFRATYLDFWGVVGCVAMMSISSLFYIIGGQWLVSKLWSLVPISGYASGLDATRFLVLPVAIS